MRKNAKESLSEKRRLAKQGKSELENLFISHYYEPSHPSKSQNDAQNQYSDQLFSYYITSNSQNHTHSNKKSPEPRERGVSTGSTIGSEHELERDFIELFTSFTLSKDCPKAKESRQKELLKISSKFYYEAENLKGPSLQSIPLPSLCTL